MVSTRDKLGVRLLTAFVVGFVILTLEIGYTRVISFKLFYYYTYFVIGLALLGLGAASAVTALSSRLRAVDTLRLVRVVAPTAAVVGLGGYLVVARLPTDVNLIWAGTPGGAVGQLSRLLAVSLALTAVFFAVGLLLARLMVAEARNVGRLYFWDLTGAAVGCLLAVPLQVSIGPPAMILTSLVVLAALGVVAAAVERDHALRAMAVAVVVALFALGAGQLKIRADGAKTIKDGDSVAAGDWGAVFRVDAVEFGDHHFLHHDGLWGSAIWRYDGTPATTGRFLTDSRQLPFAVASGDDPRVLIIGAAGGNEVQAALTYGAGHIDAVELNPVTVDLLRGEFAEYAGNITEHPDVDYIQGDGRTFLARSDDEYDIIWFVAPDSYAATNAATAGAFVLSESYLYTTQMVETAFDHLSPDGLVVAQFGDFDFDTRPTRTARYLVTAREALKGRLGSFADHTALVVERSDLEVGRASTIMLFRSPIARETVERLQSSLSNVPNARALYLPSTVREDGVTADVIDLPDDELDRVVDNYPYDISAVDDGRPFFWHFTDFRDVLTDWERRYEDSEIAIGERLLLVMIMLGAVVAFVLLGLPFAVTRRRAEVPVPGRWRFFAYFASLGLGFMLIEISMIQRFALLLGFPTLSLSVSLCTLLVATAVGARCSGAVHRLPGGLATVTTTLIVLAGVYMLTSDAITEAALTWSQGLRIALVFVLLFPIGLLLGTFLPSGMKAVVATADRSGADQGRLVAWCWAVNGFFSVLGASLTTVVSMAFGFDRAVLAGLILYVVAAVVVPVEPLRTGHATRAEPTPARTADAVGTIR